MNGLFTNPDYALAFGALYGALMFYIVTRTRSVIKQRKWLAAEIEKLKAQEAMKQNAALAEVQKWKH